MEKQLVEKVAIVTGASRGIGRAISTALAKEGATVVLAARSIEKLKETADMVTKAGGKAEIVAAELTKEESIKNLVNVTNENLGRLDILVNNAGVTHSARLEDTKTSDWDKCYQVNARGPFILCRQALPLLKKAEDGSAGKARIFLKHLSIKLNVLIRILQRSEERRGGKECRSRGWPYQ